MTLSWKLLFCVLKRNDLFIKIFLELYLVSIYVEYMYMCVHICIMNLYARVCKYVCSCFTCYFWDWIWLRHSIYLPYKCLRRRIDSIYNRSPCEVAVPLRLSCQMVSRLGLRIDIYICIYVFLRETTSSCNLLDLYFWRENDPFTTLSLFIHFVSASIWKWHAIFTYSIYGIEEIDVSWEKLCYIIWYLKRNNCVVKNIFIPQTEVQKTSLGVQSSLYVRLSGRPRRFLVIIARPLIARRAWGRRPRFQISWVTV